MSEIIAKTEKSLEVIARAVSAFESGDVSKCLKLSGDVKLSGISILKGTQYLLDRVSAVENHYRDEENSKSREITEYFRLEQAAKENRTEKERALRSRESDLRQAKEDLETAKEDQRKARDRMEEAENSKNANTAGAVAFGIATVLTLGLSAPITLPGVAVCTINAVEASNEEDRARANVVSATSRISSCNREISQYKQDITRIDKEISDLSQQIHKMKAERDSIHRQRGEITDSIRYLRDVLRFWKEFSQLTEHGTGRAAQLEKFSSLLKSHKMKNPGLSHQLQSFFKSWDTIEEKLEKGASDYLFCIDFTCQFCHKKFHSLPHLSYGRFCCIECYTIN